MRRAGESPQHGVAHGVAILVVDLLEQVEVEQRHAAGGGRRAPLFGAQQLVHVAAVGQRRQFVDGGQRTDGLEGRQQLLLAGLHAPAQLGHFAGQQRGRQQGGRQVAEAHCFDCGRVAQRIDCLQIPHDAGHAGQGGAGQQQCAARVHGERAEGDGHHQHAQERGAQRAGDRIAGNDAADREQRLQRSEHVGRDLQSRAEMDQGVERERAACGDDAQRQRGAARCVAGPDLRRQQAHGGQIQHGSGDPVVAHAAQHERRMGRRGGHPLAIGATRRRGHGRLLRCLRAGVRCRWPGAAG